MSYKDTLATLKPQVKSFNTAIGDTARGFGAIAASLHGDGALSHQHKECVALGIAVAIRCEPCILLHTEALIRMGTTREVIAEVLAVAVEMGGGPAVMYGARALAAYDELSG